MYDSGGLWTVTLWEAVCSKCGVHHPDGLKDTPAQAVRAARDSGWVGLLPHLTCDKCRPHPLPMVSL